MAIFPEMQLHVLTLSVFEYEEDQEEGDGYEGYCEAVVAAK